MCTIHFVSIIYRMLDAEMSHLDVTWVSQPLYSGPLSNPDLFLSLIAGRIRQVVLYIFIFSFILFFFSPFLSFIENNVRECVYQT